MLQSVPMATVNVTLRLEALFSKEDGWHVASFPALDVSSQGRTKDEAERNLIEATQLFLESCFERGTLDEVLKGCGFTPLREGGHQNERGEHLTVPFELVSSRNGSPAHAG